MVYLSTVTHPSSKRMIVTQLEVKPNLQTINLTRSAKKANTNAHHNNTYNINNKLTAMQPKVQPLDQKFDALCQQSSSGPHFQRSAVQRNYQKHVLDDETVLIKY